MALSSDWKKAREISAPLEETLDALEKLLERTKVMFEQYFMGIQKVAPMQLHRDLERRIRELTQQQIRNTGLRFRFTTISQRFGAYNTYWKRTLREIEQGRYVRDLARVKRRADRKGEDLPDELLAKLPKLAQERIRRERARMAERAARAAGESGRPGIGEASGGAAAGAGGAASGGPGDAGAEAAPPSARPGVHEISEEEAGALFGEGDLDMDRLFGALGVEPGAEPEAAATAATAAAAPGSAAQKPAAPGPAPGPAALKPAAPRPAPVTPPRRPAPPASATPRPAAPPPIPARPPVPRPPTPPPLRPVGGQASAAPRPPAAAPRPPGNPPAAGAPRPAGMSDEKARELYARYNKARQMVGDTSAVPYEKLMGSIARQTPAILEKHGARSVDWQVVVRGDKVVLKAKPVK